MDNNNIYQVFVNLLDQQTEYNLQQQCNALLNLKQQAINLILLKTDSESQHLSQSNSNSEWLSTQLIVNDFEQPFAQIIRNNKPLVLSPSILNFWRPHQQFNAWLEDNEIRQSLLVIPLIDDTQSHSSVGLFVASGEQRFLESFLADSTIDFFPTVCT